MACFPRSRVKTGLDRVRGVFQIGHLKSVLSICNIGVVTRRGDILRIAGHTISADHAHLRRLRHIHDLQAAFAISHQRIMAGNGYRLGVSRQVETP